MKGDTQWALSLILILCICYKMPSFSLNHLVIALSFYFFECACVCMWHSIFECHLFFFSFFSLLKGGGVPVPSLSSAVPAQSQTGSCTEDRYAALAELDNKLSSSVTTGSNVQG